MLKKLIHGLIFGAGFAVSFLAILSAGAYFFMPSPPVSIPRSTISSPPVLDNSPRFLGTSGSYSGGFLDGGRSVLDAGPGRIVGRANADGVPVGGLRLRLALEGSAYTQWAVTDENGAYSIPLPYGEYRLAGYELDRRSADQALPGRIMHPARHHSTQDFTVTENAPGRGMHFEFVYPVRLLSPGASYRADDPVVVRWEPHPGATSYLVQVYEKDSPETLNGRHALFPWRDRPRLTRPLFDPRAHGATFKPGKFYVVMVQARGSADEILSENSQQFDGYHFMIRN